MLIATCSSGCLPFRRGWSTSVLFTAFNAWTPATACARWPRSWSAEGVLDPARCAPAEALVSEHLKLHDGDVEKSLSAITTGRKTRESLARLGDADVADSLALVGTNHDSFEMPTGDARAQLSTRVAEGRPAASHVDLLAEQHDRWDRGDRVLVEAFIERDPSLLNDAESLLDLIYNEIVLREQRGEVRPVRTSTSMLSRAGRRHQAAVRDPRRVRRTGLPGAGRI